ncbi:Endosulphine [Plasmopara halstedii]|uniref:Endosulphine n=1 Tax=Plasmopara halstedii TaxID=4781 RepID=A0A0P1AUF1_PLAHL|nr:Endosulphine [Plasmopara halstedii]CEG45312.1 Endosulphine [Plasmopara halstedii]|eukprot:XP_024581681.1 Endosulphine [Plasmopara halstedii]
MDYRQYQTQDNSMLSSSRGMARLNGSNRAAWNAMDLEIGAQVPPANARGAEDGGALSARNVLLHQKLRERKRFDSADDAMKKAAARAASRYQSQSQSTKTTQASPRNQMSTQALPVQENTCQRPYSPAQIGQSAFFNAMQGDSVKSTRNIQSNTPAAMNEPLGGAQEARNVLIQRKLQSKTTFDSADYQMAKGRQQSTEHMEDTPMQDVSGVNEPVSSPCATSVANGSRRQFANMSPSRASKYGSLESRKKPNRRDLLDKQQNEDDATNLEPQHTGASDYGKLSAAHVLIRRKLKERKRFDSADYAMEKQGQPTDVPADVSASRADLGATAARYGTLGASQASIDHQVKHIKLSEAPSGRVASPANQVIANAAQAAMAARAARYAGIKGYGQANQVRTNGSPQATCDRYGLDKNSAPSPAAIARNVVLQQKLAERKAFDSADYFNKAA